MTSQNAPFLPGSTHQLNSAKFFHFRTGKDEFLIAPSQGKKRKYTYVNGILNFKGYKPYSLCVLIDTGATTSCCHYNALPSEKWQQMKHPIGVQGIDAEAPLNVIQFKAKDVAIWLNDKKFIIPKILCFPYMHGDFILGCNFIYSYLPLQLNEKTISLTQKDQTVVEIPIQENLASVCNEKFSPPKRDSDALVLQDTHWLYNSLRQNFAENPLTLWKRSPRFCRLQLKNRNVIIRVKPMIYLRRDIDEFDAQLQDLLEKKLIERTRSPHSSPAFMVRNHSELKRGKARMVINYKRLNEHLIFDGYFIPRKDVLLNQTRGSTIFSKFDCKAGFWQIKLRKKSKPLTAFSTPHGHYQWTVMPFGLNTAPQIYQRWMDSIFNDLKDFVVVYIDDILVFSKTRDEHKKHLLYLSEKLKKSVGNFHC
ncbi:uncharacterized protein LOC132309041 [Cornus florida]|uniref:uncharacterized protein LOC132309041 n=1 Tax=Cornus florida TaxID=4283 RepID=UPI0028A0D163|nr:uncharacterized protein LOC132309041 [Cornus florida]